MLIVLLFNNLSSIVKLLFFVMTLIAVFDASFSEKEQKRSKPCDFPALGAIFRVICLGNFLNFLKIARSYEGEIL